LERPQQNWEGVPFRLPVEEELIARVSWLIRLRWFAAPGVVVTTWVASTLPLENWKGKNLLFIGGGIGLAPLRSLIFNVLDNRRNYREITILYGARSPQDLCFKYDLEAWAKDLSIKMVTTVDGGDKSWKGHVGLVPIVLEEIKPSPEDAAAITCGPPIMIRYTLKSLEKLDFSPTQVWTTLEMKMKCGLGKCGRCNIGPLYVCRHGPVFSLEEIRNFTSNEF